MKTITLFALSLFIAIKGFAGPQIEIEARYEGLDLYRSAELASKESNKSKAINAPRVTTKSGQRCMVEIVREIQIPKTPDGEKTVNAGLTLTLDPVVQDRKIVLAGTSVMRRRLPQTTAQPLDAISFTTHETFFKGTLEDGKEIAIAVGDGPKDKSRIILKAHLVSEDAAKAK